MINNQGERVIIKDNTKMMKQQQIIPFHTSYILSLFYYWTNKHMSLQALNHHHQVGWVLFLTLRYSNLYVTEMVTF
jgi:hypothetical protein